MVQGRAGRTSIFLRVIFGISHTKLYMPSPASSGISCHGEIVLPSCTRQHKAVCVCEAPLLVGQCARHARSARTFLKYMVKSVVPNSPDFSTVMSMRGAASLLMAARLTRTAPPICML